MKLHEAKVNFESVIISPEKRQTVEAVISQLDNSQLIFTEWGFDEIFEKGTAVSMIFFGIPGTGKTLMAQAIATKLKQELLVVGPAEVESSTPGQSERNIKNFFKIAAAELGKIDPDAETIPGREPTRLPPKKHILLFDECDSLITDRQRVGMVIAGQINTLLGELETFEGVVIFTTNRLGNLDVAIERRISAKIEFEFPTEEMRLKIWQRMIPKKCPIDPDVDLKELAKFPLTGGNIKNCVLASARDAAYRKLDKLNLECFTNAIEKELEGIISFEEAFKKQPKVYTRDEIDAERQSHYDKTRKATREAVKKEYEKNAS